MKTVNIRLSTVDNVKRFVNDIMEFDCEFDIVSDRYIVDAKSIMGIFSLDLSKILQLRIQTDDEQILEKIEEKIKRYIQAE